MTDRKHNGQFEKGRSGNPRGRPSKRQTTHRTPAGYRVAMLEVAAMPVSMIDRETGEPIEISLLKANMLALGRKGAAGHAPSAKAFLEKHYEAAGVHGELTQLHRYLMEENARLELQVEQLLAKLPKGGGVVHADVLEEDWMRLVNAKEEAWRDRKVDVNPRQPIARPRA